MNSNIIARQPNFVSHKRVCFTDWNYIRTYIIDNELREVKKIGTSVHHQFLSKFDLEIFATKHCFVRYVFIL